jgi:hypothetical protein
VIYLLKGVIDMKKLIFLTFVTSIFLFMIGMIGFVYAQEQNTGQISGKLMIKDGGPMVDGLVHFFNAERGPIPNPDKYWMVPDSITETTHNGEFTIKLPEGQYYMGAIKRISGKKEVGPPLVGDYFFISSDEKGTPKLYVVKKGEDINIGTISEATPFKGWSKDKITAIDGRVFIDDGKPVEGALVFGYVLPTMVGKPDFVSERSDKDGKYILRVPEGGSYYLMARDIYGGGPPAEGSIMGVYGAKAVPIAVTVKTGESTKGIDIKVIRFPGRGPREEGMKRFTIE